MPGVKNNYYTPSHGEKCVSGHPLNLYFFPVPRTSHDGKRRTCTHCWVTINTANGEVFFACGFATCADDCCLKCFATGNNKKQVNFNDHIAMPGVTPDKHTFDKLCSKGYPLKACLYNLKGR